MAAMFCPARWAICRVVAPERPYSPILQSRRTGLSRTYANSTPGNSGVLAGRDLMASAQTGTGRRPVRALILTPTRELAAQIGENVEAYSKHLRLRSLVVFGGVSINPQMMKLRGGVDILVATPGRLLDLEHQNAVDLSKIEILVLDEADRMLDMGFIHDIRRVLSKLPAKRQNLLFSATFSDEIKGLASKLLTNPASVEVARRNTASEQIEQSVHFVDKKRKRELLSQMIGEGDWKQVLVFNRTKHGANHLAEQLNKDGITAAAIHGNKSQGARTRALADFKDGKIRVLVATDIAARGLDIDQLPHVVNYELPNVPEDYVHRIAVLAEPSVPVRRSRWFAWMNTNCLRDIERLLKREIPRIALPGYEPDPSIKAEPIINGHQLVNRINDCEIVVIMRERTPFTGALLSRLPKLQLLITSGMRNASIDLPAAARQGVTVCGTASGSEAPMELTWALILGLAKHLVAESGGLRANGPWQQHVGITLHGKTFRLTGAGARSAADGEGGPGVWHERRGLEPESDG
ncbi:hypothetical protein HA402_008939 [Bradysia odoriphaga]|nr:hypothetical protein HA402_008939 [Bradysia odoriphaga]